MQYLKKNKIKKPQNSSTSSSEKEKSFAFINEPLINEDQFTVLCKYHKHWFTVDLENRYGHDNYNLECIAYTKRIVQTCMPDPYTEPVVLIYSEWIYFPDMVWVRSYKVRLTDHLYAIMKHFGETN